MWIGTTRRALLALAIALLLSLVNVTVVCMHRKSETERRSMNQQNKDVELVKKVQQLESEKQAVDVCIIQLNLTNRPWMYVSYA